MTATIDTTRNEIAKIEAEAEELAQKNANAQLRLARLRAEQQRVRQERLTAWARKTLAAWPADRADADKRFAQAGRDFKAAVAAGDMSLALAKYHDWLAVDAQRLALVDRHNTTINYLPEPEQPREIINHRTIMPDFLGALADAAREVHATKMDAARDEVLAEYRRLVDGDEGEG